METTVRKKSAVRRQDWKYATHKTDWTKWIVRRGGRLGKEWVIGLI